MRVLSTLVFLLLAAPPLLLAEYVWVEGESGRSENLRANGWYTSVRSEDLSGGRWLASYGGEEAGLAVYEVDVSKTGDYTLWVRANPIQARLQVSLIEAEAWREVPISKDREDMVNIASDGKPDMRFLAWTKIAPIPLKAGKTPVRFRFSSKNGNHGALDCFCLTTDASWKPSKALKPNDSKDWPAPVLTDANIRQWSDFIRPSSEDLSWRGVRWHRHLDEAAAEAAGLGRPVLLWAMNGHPCGET